MYYLKDYRTVKVTMDVVGAPTILADAPLVNIDRGSHTYSDGYTGHNYSHHLRRKYGFYGKVWVLLICGHEKLVSTQTQYRARCSSCLDEQVCL